MVSTSWTLVTGPTFEPVTVDEAKRQARIVDQHSDDVIASYIRTAREEAESALNFGILTQTWRLDLSAWAERIPLPMAYQLQSITNVKYYDGDGTLQTLSTSTYTTDAVSRPAAVVRASNYAWPTLQADRLTGKIQITYVVGWTTAAAVPERIKQGMKMFVTYLDADRDGAAIFGNVSLADKARESAYACWADRLYWIEPSCA